MKILILYFEIADPGGIINHTEHLIHGLKSLGHEPILRKLENKEVVRGVASRRTLDTGFSGIRFEQKQGWVFTKEDKIPFLGVNWRRYTSQFDLVIWEVPIPPSKQEFNLQRLYDIRVPQIMFIHDGNAVKLYPEVAKLAKKIDLLACVHPCALGNVHALGIRNAKLVVNPQANIEERLTKPSSRGRTYCSFQTFKAWKRVHELVAAAPLIDGHFILGGGGIEYYYMTSQTKRKPQYGDIWERALESGMEYTGYVPESVRDEIMKNCSFVVDPSWSNTYARYGSHFNRVMVDGIVQGCVPVLRDKFMEGNGIFEEDVHYKTFPHDATKEELAASMNAIMASPFRKRMVQETQKLVAQTFDSRKVARELLKDF